MTSKCDKGLLKLAALEKFKQFLTDHGIEHRPGKGQYQVLQVKHTTGWHVVCRDATETLSTPVDLRHTVEQFNASGKRPAKSPPAPPPKPRAHFLEDLRDDIAIEAMRGALASLSADSPTPIPDAVAVYAYAIADAMLAERSKR